MAQTTRTFRIFVSSTFSDMKEERNALQRNVFPRLRELCMQHGCRFQAIDLRWGVRDEAGLDQQTMKICLDEVSRSQRTSPRPNFIVLLGDRYGWRLLPAEIPAREFAHIEARTNDLNDRQLLDTWYKRDENARHKRNETAEPEPVYCLQPRSERFTVFQVWENEVERPLRAILLRGINGLDLTEDERRKYEASATEQEIAAGALKVRDASEHVFCFFRSIKDLPADESAKDFIDLDENGSLDSEALAKVKHLKGSELEGAEDKGLLETTLLGNIHRYSASWTGTAASSEHIGSLPDDLESCRALINDPSAPKSLCVDVWKRLASVIEGEIERLEKIELLEKEIKDHADFAEDRARVFIGRAPMREKISDYLRGSERHPLAVWGESGSGKSALMAKAIADCRSRFVDSHLVYRFIGATPPSSDGRSLLELLCRQITRIYGGAEETIPTDYRELVKEFGERLKLATAQKPLVVFLDAPDQLSDADHARNLIWLPVELPEHVRLVVSTLPGECKTVLERKVPSGLVKLEPMPKDEADELLEAWLTEAARTLQPRQREEVLNKFALSARTENESGSKKHVKQGMPLYLKLAFEEARRWKSYSPAVDLAPDIPGVIRQLFDRLSLNANHGKVVVSRSLAYLAAAKNGLSEDELLDVLSQDDEVLADFKFRAKHTPPEQRLPVIVWSRLYFDLEPYLVERAADGVPLITFYHRQLDEIVQHDYLHADEGCERHRRLAAYFADDLLQPLERVANGSLTANLRRLSELPYQQIHGELGEELHETLTDFHFLELKAAKSGVLEGATTQGNATPTYTGVYLLQEDLNMALQAMSDLEGPNRPGIIVTPTDFGKGMVILCPYCNTVHTFDRECSICLVTHDLKEWQGKEKTCPNPKCKGSLKVNEFVVRSTGRSGAARNSESKVPLLIVAYTKSAIPVKHKVEKPCRDLAPEGQATLLHKGSLSRQSLSLVASLLGRESHILIREPSLMASDLHNALFRDQGEEGIPGLLEGRARDALSGRPWLRLRNRPAGAQSSANLVLKQGARVTAVAWSPTMAMLASGDTEGRIRLWDWQSGRLLNELSAGRAVSVSSLCWAPDQRLASGHRDGTVQVWDSVTWAVQASWAAPSVPDHGVDTLVAWSAQGSLAVGVSDEVFVFASPLQRERRSWRSFFKRRRPDASHAGGWLSPWRHRRFRFPVEGLSWSPSCEALAFACDGLPTLAGWWQVVHNDVRRIPPVSDCFDAVVWSPDGTSLVLGDINGAILQWNLDKDCATREIDPQRGKDGKLAVTPDASTLASVREAKTVRVLHLPEADLSAVLAGHRHKVMSLAWSPDGKFLATGSLDETVRVWHPAIEADSPVQDRGHAEIGAVAWSPDGQVMAAASPEGIALVDGTSGVLVRRIQPKRQIGIAAAVGWSFSGEELALEDDTYGEHSVWIVQAADNQWWHLESANSFAWSPNRRELAIDIGTGVALAHPVTGDQQRWSFKRLKVGDLKGHSSYVSRIVWSPSGSLLASGSGDGSIVVWDQRQRIGRTMFKGHENSVHELAWSPDEHWLASASFDGTLRLWDVVGNRPGPILRAEPNLIAFSPDGQVLAGGDRTGLRLWRLPGGQDLTAPDGVRGGPFTALIWSPDGLVLATGGHDAAVRIWEPVRGRCLATAHCLSRIAALQFEDGGRILRAGDDGAATGNRPTPCIFEVCNEKRISLVTQLRKEDLMEEKWPDADVMDQVFRIYRSSDAAGLIQHIFSPEAKTLSPEALAKATIAILNAEIPLAVDVFNGVLFIQTVVLEGAVKLGAEEDFKKQFRIHFYALKDEGVKAELIKIGKNGEVKFIA